MIASNNLFVKGLTRFLPNGRVFGVGGRNDNMGLMRFLPNGRVFGVGGRNDNAKHLSRHAVTF